MDEEARDKIANDLDHTYLVEAGAGTGKTREMVNRIIKIISTGRAKLSQIVAITFTEKAAQELKTRIKEKLEDCAQGALEATEKANNKFQEAQTHIVNPEHQPKITEQQFEEAALAFENAAKQHDLLHQAVMDMDHAEITTIHGFCSGLLRERPLEAKVDIGFDVANQAWANRLFEQAWEEWIGEQLQQASPFFLELLRAGMNDEQLHSLAKRLATHRELVENFVPQYEPVLLPEMRQWLQEEIDYFAISLSSCKKQEDRGYQQLTTLIQDWRYWLSQSDAELNRRLLYEIKINTKAGDKTNWSPSDSITKIKERLTQIKARLEAISAAVQHNLMQQCIAWLKDFLEHYRNIKRQKKILDFEDLLNYTRNLLTENLAVRGEFQQQYQFLLVDEFQDTDPLQAEILFFLAEETPIAQHWKDVKLKPGKLFVVGDPKQAIYRFRRADIEIYQEVKGLVGQNLKIVKNFRSHPEIIAWVNHCFSQLIQKTGAYQPEYIPLYAARDELASIRATPPQNQTQAQEPMATQEMAETNPSPDTKQAPRAAVHFIRIHDTSLADEEDENTAAMLNKQESHSIAQTIQEIMKPQWMIKDRQHDDPRPIQYSDIAILVRHFDYVQELEQALAYYQIPYQVIGGKSYYNRIEVHSIIALLQALLEPYNAVAVLAALRSPIFTVSDQDILAYHEKFQTLDYRQWNGDESEDTKYIRQVAKVMNELHGQLGQLNGPDFLDLIFEKTGMLSLFLAMSQGEQKVANLLKIQQLSYHITKLGLEDFRRFIQYLIELRQKEEDESESTLSEDSTKNVRIITIHSSKGLEFPVVFLADMAYCSHQRAAIIMDRERRVLELSLQGKVQLKTKGYAAAMELEKDKMLAEEKRLIYVAATRARDYLFLFRSSDPRHSSYGEWLAPFFTQERGEDYWLMARQAAGPSLTLKKLDGHDPLVVSRPWQQEWQQWSQNRQQLIQQGSIRLQSWNFAPPPLAAQMQASWQRQELLRAAIEQLLISWSLQNKKSSRDLQALLQGWLEPWIMQYQLSKDEQIKVITSIEKIIASPLLQRAQRANFHCVGMPISWIHHDRWLETKLPLVFVERDKLYFVLYKSQIPEENYSQNINFYQTEAGIYALAIMQMTPLVVKEAIIYFWESHQARAIAMTNERLEKLKESLL